MDNSIIAVRVANGTYVPIMDTGNRTRRRLVLTTVRDDQTSVQIDLYRGSDEFMQGAVYVGSLMIENIESAAKGQADIAFLIGIDDSGNLNATATDKNSGEYQSLSVSLESIDQVGSLGMPDFELSDEELTLEDLSMDDDEIALDESAAELSLDDVSLEEDLSLDFESEPGSDTLAAAGYVDTDEDLELDAHEDLEVELAGLEEFSEESIGLDDSFAEEPGAEATDVETTGIEAIGIEAIGIEVMPDEASLDEMSFGEPEAEIEEPIVAHVRADAGSELESDELADLGEGMVEADLGDEDFSFDESALEPDENLFEEPMEAAGAEIADDLGGDFGDDVGAEFGEHESADEFQDDLSPDEFARLDSSPDESALHTGFGAEQQTLAPRRSNAIVFVGYIILALAALGVLTYLVFRLLEGPPAPPLQAALPILLVAVPERRGRRRRRSRQTR